MIGATDCAKPHCYYSFAHDRLILLRFTKINLDDFIIIIVHGTLTNPRFSNMFSLSPVVRKVKFTLKGQLDVEIMPMTIFLALNYLNVNGREIKNVLIRLLYYFSVTTDTSFRL